MFGICDINKIKVLKALLEVATRLYLYFNILKGDKIYGI